MENDAAQVTLEIKDNKGEVVRRYTSQDQFPAPSSKLNIPTYWIRPNKTLGTKAGMQRFLWDLHYTPAANVEPSYPMSAVARYTAPAACSPWVVPGEYALILTIAGPQGDQTLRQTIKVEPDPRVKASAADYAAQFTALQKMAHLRPDLERIDPQLAPLDKEIETIATKTVPGPLATQIDGLRKKLRSFDNDDPRRRNQPLELDVLQKLKDLFSTIEKVDGTPPKALQEAVDEIAKKGQAITEQWSAIRNQDLPELNRQLAAAGQPQIKLPD